MRKIALVFLASVALLGPACGGGSDKKDDASNGVNRSATVAAAAKACDSRDAVSFAANVSSAGATSGQDFSKLNERLHAAAKTAPSEIKADFEVFADGVGPFMDAWASANGDYTKLQSSEFQAAAQKASSPEVKEASANITAYFAEHCKG